MSWIDVGSTSDLSEATPLSVEIDGLAVVVVRCGNDVYAVEDRCTHDGEPLEVPLPGKVEPACAGRVEPEAPCAGAHGEADAHGAVQGPTAEVGEGEEEQRCLVHSSAHGAPAGEKNGAGRRTSPPHRVRS